MLLDERSTAPVLLVASLFRVAGFTVADRPVLLLRTFASPLSLVLLLVLSTLLLRPVVDLLLAALALVVLSLDTSGRYTLTALLLTRVDLPERLLVFSSLRTVAFLPVARS